MAGVERGAEKGEERYPVLGVANGKGANGWNEVVVEDESRGKEATMA